MNRLQQAIRRAVEPQETDTENVALTRALLDGFLCALPLATLVTVVALAVGRCAPLNVPFLRPRGCPIGVDPAVWRRALEQRIDQHAAALSTLIDVLDAIDGDSDREPWLGSPELNSGDIAQDHWGSGIDDDREQEDEHGGDVLDERHDEIDEGNTDYSCDDDLPLASQMSDADRDAAYAECDRLLATAYAQAPGPTVLRFPGMRQ